MAKPRRVAWDACTWIATIIQEKVPLKDGGVEDRAIPCNHAIALATARQLEIATSGLSLAEVCKNENIREGAPDAIAAYFRHSFIVIVPVDRVVGTLAREIMQQHRLEHPGLRPPDAVHLASALIADVSAFHTFDRRLLTMTGKLTRAGGGELDICKPPLPPRSLFD